MFRNKLAEFVYLRTYARWREEEGRRENWEETVNRVGNFLADRNPSPCTAEAIYNGILNQDIMPSMRLMQFGGSTAQDNNLCMYNCSYISPVKLKDFADILYILMCGVGVGFSVESHRIEKLPRIKFSKKLPKLESIIQDSREGWADALLTGLEAWYNGRDIEFDYSLIRPAGARLKTFGGRASGPDPLRNTLQFVRQLVLQRQGKRLKPVNVNDIICKIGECVVAGGTRRSALISLSDLDDSEMRDAKQGQFFLTHPYRSMANNSTVYMERPGSVTFMKEWLALAESGTGERGIFNRSLDSLKKHLPTRRLKELTDTELLQLGTNPCLAPGTLVPTAKGLEKVEDLVGKQVTVFSNGQPICIDTFRVTGENQPLIEFTLQDGSTFKVTPSHKMIRDNGERLEAKDLKVNDKLLLASFQSHGTIEAKGAYLKGFLIGDGTSCGNKPILYLYWPKYCCKNRLIESASEIQDRFIKTNGTECLEFKAAGSKRECLTGLTCRTKELLPYVTTHRKVFPAEVYKWNRRSKLEFLAGLFDSDGTASKTKNGFLYQISSVSLNLIEGIQTLLKTFNIRSKISLDRLAGVKDFNDGYGLYNTQDCWRLTLSQIAAKDLSTLIEFSRLTSFKDEEVRYNLKPRYNKIVSIRDAGISEKVYCCTVPITHSLALSNGIEVGQCGEILLQSHQFCNLSEVVVRPEDTEKTLIRKVMLATIIGTIQSSYTNFPYIDSKWKETCDRERLLGVSLTGIYDHKSMSSAWYGYTYYTSTLDGLLLKLKKAARRINRVYAKALGINASTCITCIKPSGTVSQIVDSASGIHPRFAPYYIRRVRVNTHDPIFKLLKDQNVPYYPETGQSLENMTTAVLEFIAKAPEGSQTRNDISAEEHLDLVMMYKTHYTEHNPSVTIQVDKDEWLSIGNEVYNQFDNVGGLSFLPKYDHVYPLAPYEEITEEEYNKRAQQIDKIDFTQLYLYEKDDNTDLKSEAACVGGKCEL